jgi:hypothetical protein
MKKRAHYARLRLIVTSNIEAPRQRRTKPKPRKPNPRTVRAALWRTLREQRQKIAGWPHFERADAPELYDLAIAADRAPDGRREFYFRGVRFRLKFGFRRYVVDPKTGAFLIGGRFLE